MNSIKNATLNLDRCRLFMRVLRVGLISVAFMAGPVGCQWVPPLKYNTPPTAMQEPLKQHAPPKPTVVLGDFDDPIGSPVKWKKIGRGVSQSLNDALLNQGLYEVWHNERLASKVKKILSDPPQRREAKLRAINRHYKDVRYVVIGSVTDFHHTRELPRNVGRRDWWLVTNKKEAITAIHFRIVDLQAGRVLFSDHVYGVRDSGWFGGNKLYNEIGYDSYLFWNSPLGRATENAIDDAVEVFNAVVTGTGDSFPVAEQLSDRRVRLKGVPRGDDAITGDFYVCHKDAESLQFTTIQDMHTGLPLKARIVSSTNHDATAWIQGQAPPGVDLSLTTLCRRIPQPFMPSMPPIDDPLDLDEPEPKPVARRESWWSRLLTNTAR